MTPVFTACLDPERHKRRLCFIVARQSCVSRKDASAGSSPSEGGRVGGGQSAALPILLNEGKNLRCGVVTRLLTGFSLQTEMQ